MKHFIKKFKYEIDVNDPDALSEAVAIIDTSAKPEMNLINIKKNKIKTRFNIEGRIHIDSFVQKINDNQLLMPLPDITLVYLDQAYRLNYVFKNSDIEKKLILDLKNFTVEYNLNETTINSIYTYIGYKTAIITMLFTSLESFFNQYISGNLNRKIKVRQSKYYEIGYYHKFCEKIKDIIPFLSGKKYDLTNGVLIKLNEIRNDIIHLKYGSKGMVNSELIDRIINFDFDKNYLELFKYYNFHMENYVQECQCSSDY